MLRAPFFEISPEAYLYPDRLKAAGDRKQLEEPVRQWCAYELIRAYGVAIGRLLLEIHARLASLLHWVPIGVLLPHLRIEAGQRGALPGDDCRACPGGDRVHAEHAPAHATDLPARHSDQLGALRDGFLHAALDSGGDDW
jgi:hypothetical protein